MIIMWNQSYTKNLVRVIKKNNMYIERFIMDNRWRNCFWPNHTKDVRNSIHTSKNPDSNSPTSREYQQKNESEGVYTAAIVIYEYWIVSSS